MFTGSFSPKTNDKPIFFSYFFSTTLYDLWTKHRGKLTRWITNYLFGVESFEFWELEKISGSIFSRFDENLQLSTSSWIVSGRSRSIFWTVKFWKNFQKLFWQFYRKEGYRKSYWRVRLFLTQAPGNESRWFEAGGGDVLPVLFQINKITLQRF